MRLDYSSTVEWGTTHPDSVSLLLPLASGSSEGKRRTKAWTAAGFLAVERVAGLESGRETRERAGLGTWTCFGKSKSFCPP